MLISFLSFVWCLELIFAVLLIAAEPYYQEKLGSWLFGTMIVTAIIIILIG